MECIFSNVQYVEWRGCWPKVNVPETTGYTNTSVSVIFKKSAAILDAFQLLLLEDSVRAAQAVHECVKFNGALTMGIGYLGQVIFTALTFNIAAHAWHFIHLPVTIPVVVWQRHKLNQTVPEY